MNLEDFAYLHASTFTDEKDKRKVLEWFVERVRTGNKVNSEVMKFIAAGIEDHLAGKKPWAGTRGRKKKTPEQEIIDAFPMYAEFQRIGIESLQNRKPFSVPDAVFYVGEKFDKSEDTVKRAIDTVKKGRKGRSALYGALERHHAWLSYLESPAGKAWKKSADA